MNRIKLIFSAPNIMVVVFALVWYSQIPSLMLAAAMLMWAISIALMIVYSIMTRMALSIGHQAWIPSKDVMPPEYAETFHQVLLLGRFVVAMAISWLAFQSGYEVTAVVYGLMVTVVCSHVWTIVQHVRSEAAK